MTTPSHLPSGSNNGSNSSKVGTTLGKIIELIPADHATWGQRLAAALSKVLFVALLVVAGLIVVRFAAGLLIGFQVAEAVGESAQAAGLDPSITAWFRNVASVALGFGVIGILSRVVLGWLFPFGKLGASAWKLGLMLLAASGLSTALPVGIRALRGLDAENLPAQMSEVDPAKSTWFNPQGQALIFFADHLDGTRRFWNRPGHTPRDNAVAADVTQQIHGEWLREQLEAHRAEMAARQAEEAARAEQERRRSAESAAQAERERQQREHEQGLAAQRLQLQQFEAQRAQAERARAQAEAERAKAEAEARNRNFSQSPAVQQPARSGAPRTADLPPKEFPLRRGVPLNIHTRGDRVELWSDGPIHAGADGGPLSSQPVPGSKIRFQRGAHVVRVLPAGFSATRVFIRPILD